MYKECSRYVELLIKELFRISVFFMLIICVGLFLTGCSSSHCSPTIITKEVKIPVYQELNIQERPMPKLPVNRLNSKSSNKEVVTAYDKTIIILINEVKIYQNIIKELKSSDGKSNIKLEPKINQR